MFKVTGGKNAATVVGVTSMESFLVRFLHRLQVQRL